MVVDTTTNLLPSGLTIYRLQWEWLGVYTSTIEPIV
jgi:hypothetical protein